MAVVCPTQLTAPRSQPPRRRTLRPIGPSYAALVDGLYGELADWIKGCAPELTEADAKRIAIVGVNALLGKRATRIVFHTPQVDTPDEEFVADWTAMLAGRIESAQQPQMSRRRTGSQDAANGTVVGNPSATRHRAALPHQLAGLPMACRMRRTISVGRSRAEKWPAPVTVMACTPSWWATCSRSAGRDQSCSL